MIMNSLEEYLGTKSVLNCPQCCCHAATLQEEEGKISRQLHGDTTVDGGKSEILDYSELSLVKVGKKYIHSSFVLKFIK